MYTESSGKRRGSGKDIQDMPAAAASAALRLSSFVNSRSCHRSSQEQGPTPIPISDHRVPAQDKNTQKNCTHFYRSNFTMGVTYCN